MQPISSVWRPLAFQPVTLSLVGLPQIMPMWLILQSWDCKPLLGLGVLRVGAWLHLCSGDERREAKVAPTYCVGELGELAPKFRAPGDWGATQGVLC